VLCVHNLSRFPQPVELDLRRFEGVSPIELLGGVRFPEIGELPYLLTLGAYGFYWFRLPDAEVDRTVAAATQPRAGEIDRGSSA
jgi:maltose alpha-D-glucosyltransferase/alpha-amylase